MSKKLKIMIVLAAILVLLVAAIAVMLTIAERNQREVLEIEIETVDLSTIPDGTFIGEFNSFPVAAQVEVTVKDHTITAIDLVKHLNGEGGDAEVIPDMVVEAQSLQVDTISGATYSSKVILLAIQDALQSAAGE
ncbi:MAG TPA: FMN-binding protein [Candidatus Limiplasma sp.]|nr:FMN-binding protein [Candidatus Limiplasma sp.]